MPSAAVLSILTSPRAVALSRASAETRNWILAREAADNQQHENRILAPLISFANYRIPLGGACGLSVGARTLTGALVPLVGPTPIVSNFVDGDYSRTMGITSSAIKSLQGLAYNGNFARNNQHMGCYITSFVDAPAYSNLISSGDSTGPGACAVLTLVGSMVTRSQTSVPIFESTPYLTPGLLAFSRGSGSEYLIRNRGASRTVTQASEVPQGANISGYSGPHTYGGYSVGASIDLDELDTQFGRCITALAAAGI